MARERQSEERQERSYIKVQSYEITRVGESKNGDLWFNWVLNGVCLNGCWVKKAKSGKEFIAFPQYKGKNDKYYNYCYAAIDDKYTDQIIDEVYKVFNESSK